MGFFSVFTHTSDLDSAAQTQGHRLRHKINHAQQGPFHPQPLQPHSTVSPTSQPRASKYGSTLNHPREDGRLEQASGLTHTPCSEDTGRAQRQQTTRSCPNTMPVCTQTPACLPDRLPGPGLLCSFHFRVARENTEHSVKTKFQINNKKVFVISMPHAILRVYLHPKNHLLLTCSSTPQCVSVGTYKSLRASVW